MLMMVITSIYTTLCTGYYCPPASISSKQFPCGATGVYCPEGSDVPITVDDGYYTVGGITQCTVSTHVNVYDICKLVVHC